MDNGDEESQVIEMEGEVKKDSYCYSSSISTGASYAPDFQAEWTDLKPSEVVNFWYRVGQSTLNQRI